VFSPFIHLCPHSGRDSTCAGKRREAIIVRFGGDYIQFGKRHSFVIVCVMFDATKSEIGVLSGDQLWQSRGTLYPQSLLVPSDVWLRMARQNEATEGQIGALELTKYL
jgi:hypothetical protein